MKAWSKQAFLNPATSNDDGWFKFSVRPPTLPAKDKCGWSEGSIYFAIADCVKTITLDFDIDALYLRKNGVKKSERTKALNQIKDRRKKIRLFVSAVVEAGEKIEQYLDEWEKKVKETVVLSDDV